MKRLTLKKQFEHYKPEELTTTVCVNEHIQITETHPLFMDPARKDILNYYLVGEVVERLAEYEDAEENGLLLRLPCKPGDIVYVFLARFAATAFQIIEFSFNRRKKLVMRAEPIGRRGCHYLFYHEDFNKILFFTKEAAEAELIKRQEGESWRD